MECEDRVDNNDVTPSDGNYYSLPYILVNTARIITYSNVVPVRFLSYQKVEVIMRSVNLPSLDK